MERKLTRKQHLAKLARDRKQGGGSSAAVTQADDNDLDYVPEQTGKTWIEDMDVGMMGVEEAGAASARAHANSRQQLCRERARGIGPMASFMETWRSQAAPTAAAEMAESIELGAAVASRSVAAALALVTEERAALQMAIKKAARAAALCSGLAGPISSTMSSA